MNQKPLLLTDEWVLWEGTLAYFETVIFNKDYYSYSSLIFTLRLELKTW